jgi:four helix bundle protein
MENKIYSYKDLIVWQKSVELVIAIYKLTEKFPKTEIYGLMSQMRRAAISIPSNIAEGRKRESIKDFRQFLIIAYSSSAELETQLEIVKKLPFGKSLDYSKVDSLLLEVIKMLNKILSKFKGQQHSN